MSRTVESTGLITAAAGYTLVLTCPAGKKIEILESNWYATAAAAGPWLNDVDYDGVGALVASESIAAAAGTVVTRQVFNNHRIDEGDQWYVYVTNTTGGAIGRLTYVLVDL